MTKKYANGLVITLALDAARGEAMPETVETHLGKSKLLLEFIKVAAVCTGFGWCSCVGKDIEVPSDNLLQWTDQGQQIPCHGDVPNGVLGLGFVDDEFCVFFLPIHQVDALYGFAHTDYTSCYINVIPLQGADFANAKAGI